MVPFGLNQEQFCARYRRCLEAASPHLIHELRELLARPVPDTVREATVQIFIGEEDDSETAAWIYYRGKNNKVDNHDQSIFPGRSLEIALGLENMEGFDEKYFTDEKFDGLNLVANVVKSWFAECWWKAGGWSYAVPTIVYGAEGLGDGKGIQLSEHPAAPPSVADQIRELEQLGKENLILRAEYEAKRDALIAQL